VAALPGDRRVGCAAFSSNPVMRKYSSLRSSTVARVLEPPAPVSLPAAFSEQLSSLYQVVQRSRYVFGSPMGPFNVEGRQFHLPRFVYFGPNAAEAALRLSFVAGFDHRDLRSTLALLRLVEGLAQSPDLGQGLNLSFFPLLDVVGLAQLSADRKLAEQDWAGASSSPEIALLEHDARQRAYHGFVRLESAAGEDVVTVRLRARAPLENLSPALELISSEDVEPFAVRWESDSNSEIHHGPLSIADDLPIQPFELIVRIPAAWPLDLYAEAAASILKRFVLRYRGFISYAQYL
jgi:hypothetical protein